MIAVVDENTVEIRGKFSGKGYIKISVTEEDGNDRFLMSVVKDEVVEIGCLPMVRVDKEEIIGWFNRSGGKQFIE